MDQFSSPHSFQPFSVDSRAVLSSSKESWLSFPSPPGAITSTLPVKLLIPGPLCGQPFTKLPDTQSGGQQNDHLFSLVKV